MKYVYAILTVIEDRPIMQTIVSVNRLTGRDILDRVILTEDEKIKYKSWNDEKSILEDLNKKQRIQVEIQEVEV